MDWNKLLVESVKNNNIDEVKRALDNGGNINVRELDPHFRTPLYISIEKGYNNIARLLFEKLEKVPDKLYGNSINSNYQNQGLALSKHFRLLG